jgi:hypothetical protein
VQAGLNHAANPTELMPCDPTATRTVSRRGLSVQKRDWRLLRQGRKGEPPSARGQPVCRKTFAVPITLRR